MSNILQLGSPSSPSHEQVCRSRILALAMSAPRPRLAAARGAEIGGVAASRKRGRAPVHDGAVAAGRGWPSRDAHAGEPEGVGGGAAGGPQAFMPLPPMDDQDEDTGGAESRRESSRRRWSTEANVENASAARDEGPFCVRAARAGMLQQ